LKIGAHHNRDSSCARKLRPQNVWNERSQLDWCEFQPTQKYVQYVALRYVPGMIRPRRNLSTCLLTSQLSLDYASRSHSRGDRNTNPEKEK
jgi:hypothetical protein